MTRKVGLDHAVPSDSKQRFVTTVAPFKNSDPVPEDYLTRYFSTFEPRFNRGSNEEVKQMFESRQELIDLGLPLVRAGGISHAGGVNSFMMPEADPKKVINVAAISDIAFIEDDITETTKENSFKEYHNIIKQAQARQYIKALECDKDGIKYIEGTEVWIAKEVELDSLRGFRFDSIEDYVKTKLHTCGGLPTTMLLHYCYNVTLTAEELAPLESLREHAWALATYGNDYASVEMEWVFYLTEGRQPELPYNNSVFVIMHTMDVSFAEAKDILIKKIIEKEKKWLQKRLKLEEGASDATKEYTSACQLLMGGILVWHLNTPRYYVDSENIFYPKPEYKIGDYKMLFQTNQAAKTLDNKLGNPSMLLDHSTNRDHVNGDGIERKTTIKRNNIPNAADGEAQSQSNLPPWISSYPKLLDQIVSEPYEYVSSLPSKKIRNTAIGALDGWYRVPQQSLDIIISVIDMLHNSSLIVDDIEDNSPLRRGHPAAHMIFGTPQAINAANYLFVRCLDEVQKLSPSAVAIYVDELRNLHVGQAMDLHWSFHTQCPSEGEYIQMIDGKTGGLFRLASRLMKVHATQNQNFDFDDLLNLMSRYFQIRDDYQNLCSSDYTAAKGTLSDLDEGKYSFMLIHALKNAKDRQLKSLLQLRARNNGLTMEQKTQIMKHMVKSKSLDYTKQVLGELHFEIHARLESIESKMNVKEKNWILRAIMARLSLDEVYFHHLSC
ncbi:Dimethylallyltranstransferase [Dactylellina cionopaga]|nr:Dimethylallyltranstransferase [Dactylellina cionopaga]